MDKLTQLLEDILNQQKEQTELLRKNLWRIRFSLRALLLLMTLMAVGLGYVANSTRTQNSNARRASINVMSAPTWPRSTAPATTTSEPLKKLPNGGSIQNLNINPYQNYQTPPNKVEPAPVG